jgi:hypothetical protein
VVVKKIFQMDDQPFEDLLLQPLNSLYHQKQDQVNKFWKELINLPEDMSDRDIINKIFSKECNLEKYLDS